MTLQEIIDFTRYQLGNYEKPYYWVDAELVMYCNRVIDQLCTEGRLLVDDCTPSVCDIALVEGQRDYSYSEKILSIISARLVKEEVMTLDVAPATAWAADDTITGLASTSTCVVVSKTSDTKYVVKQRTGNYNLGEILTNGTVQADQGATKPVFTDSDAVYLTAITREQLESRYPNWLSDDTDEPIFYCVDNVPGKLSIHPVPDDIYTLRLTVQRLPITAMSTSSMTATPELDVKYHNAIIDGICGYAHLKAGENTYNDKAASLYMSLFKKAILDNKIRKMLDRSVPRTFSPHGGFI